MALVHILVSIVLLKNQLVKAAPMQGSTTTLSSDDSTFLGSIYSQFVEAYSTNSHSYGSSYKPQISILVVGQPSFLKPCPVVINQDSPDGNYIAAATKLGEVQNAEIEVLSHLSGLVQIHSPCFVHLVSRYSPCHPACTNAISKAAQEHPQLKFHIGYVVEDSDSFLDSIKALKRERNIAVGQVKLTKDEGNGTDRNYEQEENMCAVGMNVMEKRSNRCYTPPPQPPRPPRPPPSPKPKKPKCFPSTAQLITSNPSQMMKTMEKLKIGDKVLVMDSKGDITFSPVIAFLDFQPSSQTEFISLKTEDGSLELSPLHLIFRNGSRKAIKAIEVAVGDFIYTVDPSTVLNGSSKKPSLSRVMNIRNTTLVGMYSPLTAEGTIVVDGIVASCYAHTPNQHVAHAVFAPLRWLQSIFPSLVGTEQVGEHWYARMLGKTLSYMEYLPRSMHPFTAKERLMYINYDW